MSYLNEKDFFPKELNSDVFLSPLDQTIPPVFISYAWAIENVTINEDSIQSLCDIISSSLPHLAGRLCICKDGLWKLASCSPSNPIHLLETRNEEFDLKSALKVREKFVLFPNYPMADCYTPDKSGFIKLPNITVQINRFNGNGLIIVLGCHHKILDGVSLVNLGCEWLSGRKSFKRFDDCTTLSKLLVDEQKVKKPFQGGLELMDLVEFQTHPAFKEPVLHFIARFKSERFSLIQNNTKDKISMNDVLTAAFWKAFAHCHDKDNYCEVGTVVDTRKTLGINPLYCNALLYASCKSPATKVRKMTLLEASILVRNEITKVRQKENCLEAIQFTSENQGKAFSNPQLRGMIGNGIGLSNWIGLGKMAYEAGVGSNGQLIEFFSPPSPIAMHGIGVVLPQKDESIIQVDFGVWKKCSEKVKKELLELLGGDIIEV